MTWHTVERRRESVRAWQWDGTAYTASRLMVRYPRQVMRGEAVLLVQGQEPRTWHPLHPGNWLVVEDGQFTVCTEEQFHARYRAVEFAQERTVRFLPAAEMRYPTVGDYWKDEHGRRRMDILRMDEEGDMLAVLCHELVEEYLTRIHGIPEPRIKAFDEAHLDADEPGELPEAPYHLEHMLSEKVERAVLAAVGTTWEAYSARVDAAWELAFGNEVSA